MKLPKIIAAGACVFTSTLALSAPAYGQAGSQFIGQISAFGANFCPRGWAEASGQLLPISQYTALFSLYGTTFGGDGRSTFALPDLRGRRPIGQGDGPGLPSYRMGNTGGAIAFTLRTIELPSHNHTATIGASRTAGDTPQPVRNSFAAAPAGVNMYLNGSPAINNMHSNTVRVQNTGGGQPVDKISPFQTIRWCVSVDSGIYPSRN